MTMAATTVRQGLKPVGTALCVATLLTAFSLAAQTSPKRPDTKKTAAEQPAAVALSGAQQAIDRQDYATAVTLLENFLLEHPGEVEALFNLAYAYSLLGRTADAIDMYGQTLEVDPKLFAAHLNLGVLLIEAEKPTAAAAELKRALELEPDNYRAHFSTAVALERLGKKQEALAHYRRAAALDPTRTEPRRAVLELLLEKEDWEEAQTALQELLALEPRDPELLRLGSDLLLRQGKDEKALAAYEDYLAVQPEDAAIHLQVGRLYREQGKAEEALRHFRAAEKNSPSPGSADPTAELSVREQADTLAALERWSEAIPLYRRTLAREPGDAELHAALGYAYLKERRFESAIRELLATLKLDPKNVEAYNHLASALYLSGNRPGAIQILDRRAALAEETLGTLFLRAMSYDELKQCAPAITYYEKFLALNRSTQSDQYFQATARLRRLKKTCRQRRR